MTTEEKQAYIDKILKDRGYILEMHKILVEADLDWVKAYDPFIEATYTGQRILDRKTKELLQIVVEAALRADVEHIQAHVRVALENGANSPGDTGGHGIGGDAHGDAGLSPGSPGLGSRGGGAGGT